MNSMPMPIDKIICVGKNYLEHARELGDAIPDQPVLFLKPASILKQAAHWGEALFLTYPRDQGDVHYECEIVLRLANDGYQMTAAQVKNALAEVSIGLDMTLRTRQAELKKAGHPWTIAKVFKDAAVVGPWIPVSEFTDYLTTDFTLSLDGQLRQHGQAKAMLVKPIDLIVYISHFFPLCAGDLIYTGTPAGVGPITATSQAVLNWEITLIKLTGINSLFYN